MLEANSREPRFYGGVVKVMDDGYVRVRWDIDQTYSIVMQGDLILETKLQVQTLVDFVAPKPSSIYYTDTMSPVNKETNNETYILATANANVNINKYLINK